MEMLNDITLISGNVELKYTGKDANGNVVEKVETFQPDPAWTAVLLRYLKDHDEVGSRGAGSREIALQGSKPGDFPGVEASRWNPSGPFVG
jgi:hypothetical protein